MKHAIAILCLLVIVSIQCLAQGRGFFENNKDKKFYGGAIGGFNFAALNGDIYDGYRKVGINAGGVVYVRLLSRLHASVELLYTQKGCRGVRVFDSYYVGTLVERYKVNLNYLELPLALHYLLNDKWSIGVGGAYAGLVKSNEEVFTDQPITFSPDKNAFVREDVSLILNANMQFYKGWFLGMRYQHSLATIRETDKIPYWFSDGSGRQTNTLFSLRLMYLIN